MNTFEVTYLLQCVNRTWPILDARCKALIHLTAIVKHLSKSLESLIATYLYPELYASTITARRHDALLSMPPGVVSDNSCSVHE